jgi:branched-chain amino acid transport system permease protein
MDEFGPQMMMRKYWPLAVLSVGVLAIVAVGNTFGGEQLQTTLIEMLIRMIVVVAMQLFIGNSGVLSFGHIGFMCVGAYAAAWATCEPNWKQLMLTGLPTFLQTAQWPLPVDIVTAGVLAALVALLFGAVVIRLSGIAASIATFAFLAIINSVYSNWETVTAGTSSIIGIPTLSGPWPAVVFVLLTMLGGFLFQNSRFGLMLRASRDDHVAATACAVDVVRVRLIAFVVSAFFVGLGGGLYAHFLGVLTVDVFYLNLTFITLSMLVVGGVGSVSGAVVGVVAVTLVVEVLRSLEAGLNIGAAHLALPEGSQEIGLGLIMALILIFRPSGLTQSREIPWPFTTRKTTTASPAPLSAADAVSGSPAPLNRAAE